MTVNISGVSAETTSQGVESTFQWCLNSAITTGLRPSRDAGLGPETCDAIEIVAMDHPEAQPRAIAAAFDAFAREHGSGRADSLPLPAEPPVRPAKRTRHVAARSGRFRVT